MTDASTLLGRGFGQIGDGFGHVVTTFSAVVGPELSRVATPTSLKRGTLNVRCSSASWAQTISMMELDLVERLAGPLGRGTVRRIVARAGGSPPPQLEPDEPPRAAPLPPLDAAAEHRLDALVEHIADPQLRSRVRAAAEASERRRCADANPAS